MSGHEKFNFKNKDEFLAKGSSLDAGIPFSDDIGALFEPLTVAGKRLPNRLAIQPMEGADAAPGGAPSELTFRRYQRFAASGCGLIWFEAAAVTENGKSNPSQLLLARNTLDGFRRLVEKTRNTARKSLGPNYSPVFILQLTHSGRFSKPQGTPAPIIAQHNPYLDPRPKLPLDYPLISDRELDDLQEVYAEAARMALETGFDGVDIKACHGYLVSELLAAREREGSPYGGSYQNRARFILETAQKIRVRVPEIIVASRLGVYDAISYPYGFGVDRNDPLRHDLSEPKAIVRRLKDIGLDLLNVTIGIPASKPHYGRPFDKPVSGAAMPDEHPLTGIARLLQIAAEMQQEFPALPVVGTGYSWLRQFFPQVGAGVIKSGGSSLIGIGRLALAYPDFARDLMDNGALNPKKVCLTCSGCSELLRAGQPAGCVVRDKRVYQNR
jgi:2,4-dienoyl-CoA reductase-like NADH-dependent reductase (Old Yellow Enzyme family)